MVFPWSSLLLIIMATITLAMAAVPGPAAPVILRNKAVTAALKNAWHLSFLKGNLYQERGGWIYANPRKMNALFVRLASKSRSKPGKGSAAGMAIDLDNPQSNPGNPPPAGYKIVANFHTHPLPAGNEKPSTADMINSYLRGVPGIVVSKTAIWYYGPEERSSMDGPVNYPGKNGQYNGQEPKKFGPNPFGKVLMSSEGNGEEADGELEFAEQY